MGAFTIGSAEYNEACSMADEQIRDDLKAGAVSDYIDGDSAQEYLGEIIRINSQRREIGESVQEWIARIGADLDSFIQQIVNTAVESNVTRVAQENQA
jgi:predicted transcriptional regulator